MDFRLDPTSAIVRFYNSSIDKTKPLHEMHTPYYKTLILQFLDNGEVRISGCVDMLSISESKALRAHLAELGYQTATWRHEGIEFVVNLSKYKKNKRSTDTNFIRRFFSL